MALKLRACAPAPVLLLTVVLIASFGVRLDEGTSSFANPKPQGESWAPCGFAVDQISIEGNGSTYGSCLACSPTNSVCPPKCQSLIDALYKQCDGVYAPQDFYFDPAKMLNGYWNDHMDVLRVKAERCGCNSTIRFIGAPSVYLVAVLISIGTSFAVI